MKYFWLCLVLMACADANAPQAMCRWRYESYAVRTDTVWNTSGPGYMLVSREMPTDSTKVCQMRGE